MKKVFTILTIICIIFSGCGSNKSEPIKNNEKTKEPITKEEATVKWKPRKIPEPTKRTVEPRKSIDEKTTNEEETNCNEFSQELTDDLKKFAEDMWGGEWGATWYNSYEDIKVYVNGEAAYAMFITDETDESTLSTMCDGLLQYDKQWLDFVQVTNKNTYEIYFRKNPYNKNS